jgi:hypothetical protein
MAARSELVAVLDCEGYMYGSGALRGDAFSALRGSPHIRLHMEYRLSHVSTHLRDHALAACMARWGIAFRSWARAADQRAQCQLEFFDSSTGAP